MISFEDFAKLDIRIGTIISAEKIPEGDKLLKLIFDIGNDETRQIMSGIAEFYPDLSVLVGKQIPVLLNIEPRKLKGYESQGMIIAIDEGQGIAMLNPERKVESGSKVR